MSNKLWLKDNPFGNQISSLNLLRGVTSEACISSQKILQAKPQRGAEPLYEGSLAKPKCASTMSQKGGDKR